MRLQACHLFGNTAKGSACQSNVFGGNGGAVFSGNVPGALTIVSANVASGTRIRAKVSQATSTAGVCGMITLRYFELP